VNFIIFLVDFLQGLSLLTQDPIIIPSNIDHILCELLKLSFFHVRLVLDAKELQLVLPQLLIMGKVREHALSGGGILPDFLRLGYLGHICVYIIKRLLNLGPSRIIFFLYIFQIFFQSTADLFVRNDLLELFAETIASFNYHIDFTLFLEFLDRGQMV
jgi:hypothetical protein